MAEPTQPTEPTNEPEQVDVTPQDQPASAATENTEHMIPKSRFNEVNDAKKAAETRAANAEAELTKFREAQAKAERDAAEKRGEFENLYKAEQTKVTDLTTQLETAQTRVKQLEVYYAERLETRVADLPEHIKPLIANMDALEALKYLDENADKFADSEGARKQTAPPMHGGEGAQRRGEKQPLFTVGRIRT